MKIERINMSTPYYNDEPIVACIGYFDGLHLGHVALINQVVDYANMHQITPCLISFEPDPWIVTRHLDPKLVKHIHDKMTKIELLETLKIEKLIILEFSLEMANLSSQAFVDLLLAHLNLKALVVGFDFHYGYKGQGNHLSLIKEAKSNFEVFVIEAVNDEWGKISSSRIDEALKAGNITEVNRLLGHPYTITGKVIDGRKQGRKIGFPTANIDYPEDLLLPKTGVYAGFVDVGDKHYYGMINVGYNPTFNHSDRISLEVHILDFDQFIYGEVIKVTFNQFLRDELKFSSKDELIDQMKYDLKQTLKQ